MKFYTKTITALSLRNFQFILFIAIFSPVSNLFAGPCVWMTTGASSNWSSAAAWTVVNHGGGSCGSTPSTLNIQAGDSVIINHNINLSTSTLTVKTGGAVILNCCTLVVTGNMIFSNGSTFYGDPTSTLVVTGDLTNNNNSTGIVFDGMVNVGGNLSAGNGSQIGGTTGQISVSGTITTTGTATIFGSTDDCTTPPCSTSSFDPLAVELKTVSAECLKNGVQIKCETYSEHNNSHFVLSRSRDGKNWVDVFTVAGGGNTSEITEYSVFDTEANGGQNYYSLKQFDFNGAFEQFNTISTDCSGRNLENSLKAYPNPSNNELQIEFYSLDKDVPFNVVIRDIRGKVVHEEIVNVESGINVLILRDLIFESGIYHIEVSGNDYSSGHLKHVFQ